MEAEIFPLFLNSPFYEDFLHEVKLAPKYKSLYLDPVWANVEFVTEGKGKPGGGLVSSMSFANVQTTGGGGGLERMGTNMLEKSTSSVTSNLGKSLVSLSLSKSNRC